MKSLVNNGTETQINRVEQHFLSPGSLLYSNHSRDLLQATSNSLRLSIHSGQLKSKKDKSKFQSSNIEDLPSPYIDKRYFLLFSFFLFLL